MLLSTFEVRSFTHSWDNSDCSFGWGVNPQSWGREAGRGSGMVPFERAKVSSYVQILWYCLHIILSPQNFQFSTIRWLYQQQLHLEYLYCTRIQMYSVNSFSWAAPGFLLCGGRAGQRHRGQNRAYVQYVLGASSYTGPVGAAGGGAKHRARGQLPPPAAR